jgi:hypothetical protein
MGPGRLSLLRFARTGHRPGRQLDGRRFQARVIQPNSRTAWAICQPLALDAQALSQRRCSGESNELAADAAKAADETRALLEQNQLQAALQSIWGCHRANQYVDQTAPFKLAKDPRKRSGSTRCFIISPRRAACWPFCSGRFCPAPRRRFTRSLAWDWDSRVGNYTFDQAVTELGQPSKQVKFDDGKFAVQWITLHGGDGLYVGGGYGSGNYGMGASQTMAQSYKDHVLELTFGPDNKLVSWAKNY